MKPRIKTALLFAGTIAAAIILVSIYLIFVDSVDYRPLKADLRSEKMSDNKLGIEVQEAWGWDGDVNFNNSPSF